MFNSIIWATDGSEAADTALPYVRSLALEHHAKVTLVHCDELLVVRSGGNDEFIDHEYVRDKIRRQVESLEADGVDAHVKFMAGIGCDAAKQVSDAVDELGADIVVIATRGRTPLAQLFLGSVAQRLLELGPCPVLVVPAMPATATGAETAPPAAARA
jgi:nucleotide-binding universal stress UspA family protein